MIEGKKNIINCLYQRDLGRLRRINSHLSGSVEKRIDNEYNKTISCIKQLNQAVKSRSQTDIEYVIGDILTNILEGMNQSSSTQAGTRASVLQNLARKQQREIFVSFGGIESLLKLLSPPQVPSDARAIAKERIMRQSEYWNEIFVIFREMIMSVPIVAENYFNNDQMILLFTFLHHQSLFDNVMNILEELLALREDTFSLATIPHFFSLVNDFSARQLAHFCRVLSLVVFEPEDRQIMEGTQVLRSTELLQLRRNRMSRHSIGIVERNQNLIIEMPEMLKRLIQILRVINYGPSLHDLISHNIMAQLPITNDILTFFSTAAGITDWNHFTNLERLVDQIPSQHTSVSISHPESSFTSVEHPEDDFTAELLNAFAPNVQGGVRTMDFTNLANVVQVAQRFGIAELTPLGQALLMAHPFAELQRAANASTATATPRNTANNSTATSNNSSNAPSMASSPSNSGLLLPPAASATGLTPTSTTTAPINRRLGRPFRSNSNNTTAMSRMNQPLRARNELKFHAMLLSPHQIELVFVICTLLSGRRKLAVQKKLADYGLGDVLAVMYDRMSWEITHFNTPNPFEHVHGPNCECTPESAIRVQFLRLVHNFYDRDFLGNNNKLYVLSTLEKRFIAAETHFPYRGGSAEGIISSIAGKNEVKDLLSSVAKDHEIASSSSAIINPFELNLVEKGLLTKIVLTLLKEKVDSPYRFWLSACVENFLRGGGPNAQLLILKTGALHSTIQHIIDNCSEKDTASSISVAKGGAIMDHQQLIMSALESSMKPSASVSSSTQNNQDGDNNNNSLQTSFDFLGELVKGNADILQHLESYYLDQKPELFQKFLSIIMGNLVESNVFLRSLYLSMELLSSYEQLTSPSVPEKELSPLDFGPLKRSNSNSFPTINDQVWKHSDLFGFSINSLATNEDYYLMGGTSSDHEESDGRSRRGYLMETWVQFSCRPISEVALEVFSDPQYYQEEKRKKKRTKKSSLPSSPRRAPTQATNGDVQQSRSPSFASTISSGMIGAMKDIRKATTHFLRFGEATTTTNPPSSTQSTSRPGFKVSGKSQTSSPSNSNIIWSEDEIIEFMNLRFPEANTNAHISSRSNTPNNFNVHSQQASMELVDDIFYTPPEGPKFRRGSRSFFNSNAQLSSATASMVHDPLFSVSQTLGSYSSIPTPAPVPASNHPFFPSEKSAEKDNSTPTTASKLILSSHFPRICSFLLQEKYPILLRLITTVSLKTVNHENICCLNTALLILLFDYQRGEMQESIAKIRELANQQYRYERKYFNSCPPLSTSSNLVVQRFTGNTNSAGAPNSRCSCCDSGKYSYRVHSRPVFFSLASPNASPIYCDKCEAEDVKIDEGDLLNDTKGGEIICKNFRELLWYWREYYLRRGRDRLSIEFSSHIPFRFWNEVVDKLCADDGSPLALLPSPTPLPISPYQKPVNHLYLSRGCDSGVVVNLL